MISFFTVVNPISRGRVVFLPLLAVVVCGRKVTTSLYPKLLKDVEGTVAIPFTS